MITVPSTDSRPLVYVLPLGVNEKKSECATVTIASNFPKYVPSPRTVSTTPSMSFSCESVSPQNGQSHQSRGWKNPYTMNQCVLVVTTEYDTAPVSRLRSSSWCSQLLSASQSPSKSIRLR